MPPPHQSMHPTSPEERPSAQTGLNEYEALADSCRLTDRQKVKTTTHYVPPFRRAFWKLLSGYDSGNWPLYRRSLEDLLTPELGTYGSYTTSSNAHQNRHGCWSPRRYAVRLITYVLACTLASIATIGLVPVFSLSPSPSYPHPSIHLCRLTRSLCLTVHASACPLSAALRLTTYVITPASHAFAYPFAAADRSIARTLRPSFAYPCSFSVAVRLVAYVLTPASITCSSSVVTSTSQPIAHVPRASRQPRAYVTPQSPTLALHRFHQPLLATSLSVSSHLAY
ncbi:hypothetical protein EDB85DRAFT_2155925 [Lactarius pseudohatsudake]|nr:hypothetical protein EDB85DRAFT_2155925 [Lactarius pseudohatsudake]